MTTINHLLLGKDILLESGTNELEVLVFNVADYVFGINVAKVREILPAGEITELPKAHRSVRGVFRLRSQVIPCVSLMDHLSIEPTRDPSESKVILTDLNQQQTAFLVDEVERIHRLSWEHILAVPSLMALSQTPVVALARCADRLVLMLDFEMILSQVSELALCTEEVANPRGLPRGEIRLLLADDSPTVREAIGATLRASGYTQLRFFENGAAAWTWIEERLAETGAVDQIGDLLISDVEMPQVDGLHLTKRIKEHPQLRQIPVLLYSSIITPENQKKGAAVGADAQVSKPELSRVVELADELIAAARQRQGDSAPANASATPPKSATASAELNSPPGDHQAPATSRSTLSPMPSASPQHEHAAVASTNTSTASSADTSPPGVEPRLWTTYRAELKERVEELRRLACDVRNETDSDPALLNSHLRLLHSIKSAAMVISLEPVTRITHLMESLLETHREGLGNWPQENLARYAAWLDELSGTREQLFAALTEAPAMETELTGELAARAL